MDKQQLHYHFCNWGIVYTLACYVAFVILNLAMLELEASDPYSPAMIVSGLFWLGVIKVTGWLAKRKEQ